MMPHKQYRDVTFFRCISTLVSLVTIDFHLEIFFPSEKFLCELENVTRDSIEEEQKTVAQLHLFPRCMETSKGTGGLQKLLDDLSDK